MSDFDLPEDLGGRGHNNPPDAIKCADDAAKALSDFMSAHPIINDSNSAAMKIVYDRANLAKRDLEAQYDAETKPAYQKWQGIIAKFKPVENKLNRALSDGGGRIQTFLRAKKVEADRVAELARQEAARLVAEAEAAAKAHEEAVDDSKVGAIVDLAETLDEAVEKVDAAKVALRQEARAERDAGSVKLAGGFTHGIGLKAPKKVQRVTDWQAAITDIGLTEEIRATILKSARAYKKLKGKFPAGIVEEDAP